MTNYRLSLMCNGKIFSLKQSKSYSDTLSLECNNDNDGWAIRDHITRRATLYSYIFDRAESMSMYKEEYGSLK